MSFNELVARSGIDVQVEILLCKRAEKKRKKIWG
jgi:hypothetical protein